jgi:ABC-type branched-subunit amino acid transport system substrate-binding protein
MTPRVFVGAAAFALAAVLATGGPVPAAAQSLKIAGNLPLTGPVAAVTGNYFKAFEMGLEDGCKEQQVDCKQIKLDAQDNAEKPEQALSVVQKQLLDNPSVVVSGTSPSANAISPTVDGKGIPHFLVAFDAYITQKGKDRFRVLPNYKLAGSGPYLKYLDIKKPKKIFSFALNVSSITDLFKLILEPVFKKRGIEFQTEQYDFGAKDYSALALKARQYNPDLIIVEGYSFHIYPIIKALRTYDLMQPGRVMAALDTVDLIYNKTARDELKGLVLWLPDYEVPGKLPAADGWRARYKDKYKIDATWIEAYGYDTARLIVSTYKKSGKVDTASLLANTPFNGLVGKIEFDQDRDIKGSLTVAIFDDKGNVVEVK